MQRRISSQEKEAMASKLDISPPPLTVWLTLLAAGFLACNAGGVQLESCVLDEDAACPQGKVCQATTTTPAGQGVCVPEENISAAFCTPEEEKKCSSGQTCWFTKEGRAECVPDNSCTPDSSVWECPSGWVCQDTAHMPPGLGTCVAEGGPSVVCTPGVQGACPSGQTCWPTEDGKGKCLPSDRCALNGEVQCEWGEECWDTMNTPEGQGSCVPSNSCTLNDDSWPCMDMDEVCKPMTGMPPELGICVLEFCMPGTEDCDGLVCWAPGDATHGKCVPEDSCTPDSAEWECADENEICWDTHVFPGLGTCVPKDSCTPDSADWECEDENEICWDTTHTPTGMGTCVPKDSCTLFGEDLKCEGECQPIEGRPSELGTCVAQGNCILDKLNACKEDEVCRDTEDTPKGQGTCFPVGSCRLGADDCNSAQVCLYLNGGALGACYAEGYCNLLDDTCGGTHTCLNSSSTSSTTNLGTCVANECTEQGNECPDAWGCRDDAGSWACVPNECSAEGADSECPGDWKCKELGSGTVCVFETCVEGEVGKEAGCSAGDVCFPTEDGKGECLPEGSCRLGADDCNSAQVCLYLNGDALGTCYAEGYCNLNDDACGKTHTCLNSSATSSTENLGICVANECTAQGNECPDAWSCRDDAGSWACVPNECSAAGVDSECPGDWKCKELGSGTVCVFETCVEGEVGKEAGCSAGDVCFPTEDGKGECLPEGSCRLGADDCITSTDVCLYLTGDELGTCYAEGYCNLNDDACGKTHTCLNSSATSSTENLGICVANECTAQGNECPDAWSCRDDAGSWACVPNECSAAGVDSECPGDWKCKELGSGTVCVFETCVEGERGGDANCDKTQVCLPTADGKGECLEEGLCRLGSNADCAFGTCEDSVYTDYGIGTCVPETCSTSGVDACPENWTCKDDSGAWACVPNRCETLGSNNECPEDWTCKTLPNNSTVCVLETCTVGVEGQKAGCEEEQKCVATDDGKGLCLALESCRSGVSTSDCNSGDICLMLDDKAEFGTCYSEGHCNLLNGDDCNKGEICQNSSFTPEENLGTCVPYSCNTTNELCPAGWTCSDEGAYPICIPNACETPGNNDECPGDWTCKTLPNDSTVCVLEICTVGVEGPKAGCEEEQKCVATDDGKGLCLALESCRSDVSTSDCNSGDICLMLDDKAEFGTCYSEGHCNLLNGNECNKGEICQDSSLTPETNLGTCVPYSCDTVNEPCPSGWTCRDDDSYPVCVPNECTTLGNNDECPGDWTCKTLPNDSTVCVLEICTVGVEGPKAGCEEGQRCVATDDGKGLCLALESCRFDAVTSDCGKGDVCLHLDGKAEFGTCYSEGHCNLLDGDSCKKGEVCQDSSLTPETNLGTCIPGSCDFETLNNECPTGWTCLKNPAQEEQGLCLPSGSCTEDVDCEGGYTCEGAEDTGIGACVALPSVVQEWWITQIKDDKATPLLDTGETTENPDATWIGSGPAEVGIFSSESGTVYAWTLYEDATCQLYKQPFPGIPFYTVHCDFPAGFAGPGPTVEVWMKFGAEPAKAKTYRVDPEIPETLQVSYTLTGDGVDNKGMPNGTIRLCVEAQSDVLEEGAPVGEVWLEDIEASLEGSALTLDLKWTAEEAEEDPPVLRQCYNTQLPPDIDVEDTLLVNFNALAADKARNISSQNGALQLEFTRLNTELNIGAVTGFAQTTDLPLAWTNGHVVIGTNTSSGEGYVYLYNPDTGVLSASENVGTVTGFSALGDSGRVAISTLQRISMVGLDGKIVDTSGNTDCLPNSVNSGFHYGLTLMSAGNSDGTGPWRFAAQSKGPATSDNRLVSYAPYESDGSSNPCVSSNAWPNRAPFSSLAGRSATEFIGAARQLGVHPQPHVGYIWTWTGSAWTGPIPQKNYNLDSLGVKGIVPEEKYLWETHQDTVDVSRTSRMPDSETGTLIMQVSVVTSSVPVLDATGNAYIMVRPAITAPHNPQRNYELRLYPPGTIGHTEVEKKTVVPQSTDFPVGSPLLGEPVSGNAADTEVYVVMTNAMVYAFNAITMEFLWQHDLGINVAPTAQPLLKGNRLWVIGTNGEVRSLTVNSDGLNRTAKWPRLHRDNCNTNSLASEPSILPSCF